MKHSRFLCAFLVLMVLVACFVPLIQFAHATNLLTGWGYRKSHVINYAAGAGTLYQKQITVHYGSGTDGDDDVYLNSHSRTDFGDVRFTDDDGSTLLDYWMEEKVDSDYSIFWVKVADDLSTVAVTVYVYYGKADATTTSSFTATFIEGDSFTRADSDTVGNTEIGSRTWTERHTKTLGDFDIVSNQLKMADSSNFAWCTIPFSQYNLAMDFILFVPSGSSTNWAGAEIRKVAEADNYTTSGLLIYFRANGNIEVAGGSPTGTTTGTYTAGQNNRISIQAYNNSIKVYVNDVLKLDFTESTETGGYVDFADYALVNTIWDSFRVRKCVLPEPAHGAWGSEETSVIASRRLLVGVGL